MFSGFDDDDSAFGPSMFGRGGGFNEHFRCYSFVFMTSQSSRESLNYGGKIIMPPSALEKLARLHISYPMLFSLENEKQGRLTHAGVLEFIAEEGRIYLPKWMMETLLLSDGDIVCIKNVNLPLGTFVKIQPQHVDFLDIYDPKAVLENAMRNFSTLTQGDIISIRYNDKIYELLVMETKPSSSPGKGISIIETDLEVDFAPPVGYEEPQRPKPQEKSIANSLTVGSDKIGSSPKDPGWTPFQGTGYRLKEKKSKGKSPATIPPSSSSKGSSSGVGGNKTTDDQIKNVLASSSAGSNGVPAPLRLNSKYKLFFGFPYIPRKKNVLPEAGGSSSASGPNDKPPTGKGHVLHKTVRSLQQRGQ